MKKILFITLLVFGLSYFTNAQVSKADVQKMMTELGTSSEKIEGIVIYNTFKFYKDGTNKRSYNEYEKENGKYKNSFEVYDTGLGVKTLLEGEQNARYFYPYASISYIEMTKTGIWIYLKN